MVKEMIKHQTYLDTGYYAKGRIKRMRVNCGGSHYFKSKHKRFGKKLSDKIYFYEGIYPTITRWNRH